MRKIIQYQTFDGSIHTSQQAALRHLDEIWGANITALARDVTRTGKYIDAVTILDASMYVFARMVAINKDRKLFKR